MCKSFVPLGLQEGRKEARQGWERKPLLKVIHKYISAEGTTKFLAPVGFFILLNLLGGFASLHRLPGSLPPLGAL